MPTLVYSSSLFKHEEEYIKMARQNSGCLGKDDPCDCTTYTLRPYTK